MSTVKNLRKLIKNKGFVKQSGVNIHKLKKKELERLNRLLIKGVRTLRRELKKNKLFTFGKKVTLVRRLFQHEQKQKKINQSLKKIKDKKDKVDEKGKKEKKKQDKKLTKELLKLITNKVQNIEISLDNISLNKILRQIKKVFKNTPLLIEAGGIVYTLNDANFNRLFNLIQDASIELKSFSVSDGEIVLAINKFNKIILSKVDEVAFNKNGKAKKKAGGSFFKYTHKTKLKLDKYGVFKKVKQSNYNVNCLIRALKEGGLGETSLEYIKTFVINRNIPMCKLKQIADALNIHITVKKDKKNYYYGNKNNKKYQLGLIDEHYFIIDKVDVTSYALKNYDEVKKVHGWNKIYMKNKGKYKRNSNKKINSYQVIKILLDNKHKLLKEIDTSVNNIYKSQFYDKIKSVKNLEYVEENIRKTEIKEQEDKGYEKIFFDFETYVDKKNDNKHVPYLCSSIDLRGNKKTFDGVKCAYKLLNSLNNNTILIAHNASYDFRFMLDNLFRIKLIENGNKLVTCSAKFKNKQGKTIDLIVKDSYKLITMPLRKFPECFFNEKSIEKEVMPYELYNYKTVNERYCSIKKALKFIKKRDHEQFLKNIKRWNLKINGMYDIIEYSKIYCELDCEILMKGYEIFKKWMYVITNLNIDNLISSATLADRFLINEGCYDGVNEFSGVIREFIQKCVVGGRTMTNNNKKYHCLKKLADYDAVSLYPSAMNRMDGFLKGKPKVLKQNELNYEFLSKQSGYFVQIVIKKVNEYRQFPLISIINSKTGVRNFTNECINETIYVDKTTLEDLITFQKVEYEVIKGYYFNEGRNDKIKDVIKFLFEERLKKKKQKNKIQMIYKLIMNSSYGKTIIKPYETEIKIFTNKLKFKTYLQRNYNYVIQYTEISNGKKYKVKVIKPINKHFSRPHVGVEILSMSKRIMNEVMCLAEDNDLFIYYQDTDSMHVEFDKVEYLENLFREKYGRELTGKNMGQFHVDFDMRKAKGDIKSVESYFLGKKCYIDKLQSVDDNGETIYDYHIRMKGIPLNSIKYKAKEQELTPLELYKKLHDGMPIEFDLLKGLSEDGEIINNCNFKFNNDMTVSTNKLFTRTLKF